MGLGPKISRCGHDTAPAPAVAGTGGNPDPRRFEVVAVEQVGGNVVAEVVYPDADNYEGRKVLLYRDALASDVAGAEVLDPHFCDDGHLAPFARFEPTDDGRAAARRLASLV